MVPRLCRSSLVGVSRSVYLFEDKEKHATRQDGAGPGVRAMGEFIYCLNTSTIRPTPLLEKIAIAGKAGYQAIEPWNDEITTYLRDGGSVDELKRALAGAGLKVVSMIALHSWATSEGDEHRRVLDECRRRMEQAAELGSPVHRCQSTARSRRR